MGTGVEPQDIGHSTTDDEYQDAEGRRRRTRTSTWTIGTADIALILGTLVFFGLFVASFFYKPWREAIFTNALPLLFGLLTVAVGGVGAYRIFSRKANA